MQANAHAILGGGVLVAMLILYQGHRLPLHRVWLFFQLLKLSHHDQGGVQRKLAHPLVHADDQNFGQVDGSGRGGVLFSLSSLSSLDHPSFHFVCSSIYSSNTSGKHSNIVLPIYHYIT